MPNERGSQNKRRGWRRGRRFDISKYSLVLVMNEKREILNVKVSKQTSEASKKKVLITRVSNI